MTNMKRTFPIQTVLLALAIILIIAFFASCDNEEVKPNDEIGCVSGISKVEGSTTRVFLYCAPFREFLAGDTVSLGGREIYSDYKDHQFKVVKSCSECN
jgi:hypothetical protein